MDQRTGKDSVKMSKRVLLTEVNTRKTEAALQDCRELRSQVLHFTAPADGMES